MNVLEISARKICENYYCVIRNISLMKQNLYNFTIPILFYFASFISFVNKSYKASVLINNIYMEKYYRICSST